MYVVIQTNNTHIQVIVKLAVKRETFKKTNLKA